MKHHLILCEGFDDRAFWKGWLLHLGCTDPTGGGQQLVHDRWGRPVKGRGKYLFHNPTASAEIVVLPCEGRHQVIRAIRSTLRERNHRPDRMIVNLDSDAESGSVSEHREAIRQELLRHRAEALEDGSFLCQETRIDSVIWECDDNVQPGVPGTQTLERLVAASIQATYPDRGPSVERWLADTPRIETPTPKNYSYSYLAKWYAEHGAGDFYWEIWRDTALAEALRHRLESAFAWQVFSDLISDGS